MTLRLARLCLVALLPGLLFNTRAQPPPPGPLPVNPPGALTPAGDDEPVQIKLPDADIDTVLSALEIYTGRTILRPAQLPTGVYNLQFTRPMPKSEAILAIETVLALNLISVVPLGERFLKVVQLQQAKQEAPEMIAGTVLDRPASGRVASKIFQLEFLRVGEFFPMLSGILNPYYGQAVQLPNANAVLITDSISNLQRTEVMLQQLDKPVSAGMKPKFYPLNEAKAADVVQRLRSILTGTLQIQLGQATTYNADDRTNQIILVTDPRQYPFFDDLIAKLDIRANPNTRNEVIYLNHAKAADVVTVLSSLISKQTTAIQRQNPQGRGPGQITPPTPPAPSGPNAPLPVQPALPPGVADVLGSGTNEFSSITSVVNDERSNSVVVSGTLDDIRLIKELIAKLDIVLAQVRIEIVIAEVTLEDNHESGISALGLTVDGDKLVGFSASANANSVVVGTGTITRPGLTGPWDLAMTIAIGTTPRKGNNNIISRPAIVTSHGKEGMVFYGETRPVITGVTTIPGATTGATTSSQVTSQPIGTTLTVTPFIGQDTSVQLDIVQDVSDVTGTVTVDGNTQYIIGQRKSNSYVSAKSGDILVLGGFQKNSDTGNTNRLGPIPFIGDLLGARKKNKKRQELIFFLRPTVLTNNPAVDNADAMRDVDKMPNRDAIKQQLDPKFQPPSQSIIDRILPKS